jgi:hypothetical protein
MILPISSAAKEGIKSVPDIIKAAATTPLGIFGLMIICLGVLGFAFFNKADEYIKLVIFLLLSGGVVAFGLSITNEANRHKTSASGAASPSATVFQRSLPNYHFPAAAWQQREASESEAQTDPRRQKVVLRLIYKIVSDARRAGATSRQPRINIGYTRSKGVNAMQIRKRTFFRKTDNRLNRG